MGTLQAVYVECDAEYKRRIKMAAAERGITVARFVKEALDLFFEEGERRAKENRRATFKPIRYTPVKD